MALPLLGGVMVEVVVDREEEGRSSALSMRPYHLVTDGGRERAVGHIR